MIPIVHAVDLTDLSEAEALVDDLAAYPNGKR